MNAGFFASSNQYEVQASAAAPSRFATTLQVCLASGLLAILTMGPTTSSAASRKCLAIENQQTRPLGATWLSYSGVDLNASQLETGQVLSREVDFFHQPNARLTWMDPLGRGHVLTLPLRSESRAEDALHAVIVRIEDGWLTVLNAASCAAEMKGEVLLKHRFAGTGLT